MPTIYSIQYPSCNLPSDPVVLGDQVWRPSAAERVGLDNSAQAFSELSQKFDILVRMRYNLA